MLSRLAFRWNWRRQAAVWYAIFAVYAGAVAAFSGPGLDEWWGIWAAGGYAIAAVLAACWPGARGRMAALAAAVAGAVVPGHILATLGSVGHAAAIALLVIAGLAIAASLGSRRAR